MSWLFNTLLYDPLLNLLIFFYNLIPYKDIGISIVILTIIIRLGLYPLTLKSLKSQKALQAIQPEMQRIQKEYKDDREEQAKQLMKLYQVHKVNPLSSCLPILIQLPFLIAVYAVFRAGLAAEHLDALYPFVARPESINALFLGTIDLAKPNVLLAALAAGGQFLQSRMMIMKPQPKVEGSQDENTLAMMNKQMVYMMPLITFIVGISLPGGLTLYWLITTIFMFGQQWVIMRQKDEPIVTTSPSDAKVVATVDDEKAIPEKNLEEKK